MSPCTILAFVICRSIVLDSTLLFVSVDNTVINEINLKGPVIDYVYDDFLYVSTANYLYKIDPSEPLLIDKTPLPLRFNYLMLRNHEILLIATDEIIILDRENLAFKSGIGIEHGDSRPLIKDQSFASLAAQNNIYLINDAGAKSTARIVDRHTGASIKKIRMDRVQSSDYDAKTQSFVILEARDNIVIYDMNMNRQRRIKLQVDALFCSIHPDGFLVYFKEGILLINHDGQLVDFQPTSLKPCSDGCFALNPAAVICLDKTAVRPSGYLPNENNIIHAYQCPGLTSEIGIDEKQNFYLMTKEPIEITPLARQGMELATSKPILAASDSLWYLQIGAFASATNALQVHNDLRADGIPAFIDSTHLYRIKFGGFTNKLYGLRVTESMNLSGWFVYDQRAPRQNFEEFYIGPEKFVIKEGVVRKE